MAKSGARPQVKPPLLRPICFGRQGNRVDQPHGKGLASNSQGSRRKPPNPRPKIDHSRLDAPRFGMGKELNRKKLKKNWEKVLHWQLLFGNSCPRLEFEVELRLQPELKNQTGAGPGRVCPDRPVAGPGRAGQSTGCARRPRPDLLSGGGTSGGIAAAAAEKERRTICRIHHGQ